MDCVPGTRLGVCYQSELEPDFGGDADIEGTRFGGKFKDNSALQIMFNVSWLL
jgi:hypothetical protein